MINWIIDFIALGVKNSKIDQKYDQYSCLAQIVSVDEFLKQFQIDMQDLFQTFSEGEIFHYLISKKLKNKIKRKKKIRYINLGGREIWHRSMRDWKGGRARTQSRKFRNSW